MPKKHYLSNEELDLLLDTFGAGSDALREALEDSAAKAPINKITKPAASIAAKAPGAVLDPTQLISALPEVEATKPINYLDDLTEIIKNPTKFTETAAKLPAVNGSTAAASGGGGTKFIPSEVVSSSLNNAPKSFLKKAFMANIPAMATDMLMTTANTDGGFIQGLPGTAIPPLKAGDLEGKDVPNKPGYIFRGEDITRKPELPVAAARIPAAAPPKQEKQLEWMGPASLPNPLNSPSDEEYRNSLNTKTGNIDPKMKARQLAYDAQMALIGEDPFLTRLSGIESDYGRNLTTAKTIPAGKTNAGQHAIGALMMMPGTVDMVARDLAAKLTEEGSEVPETLKQILDLRDKKYPKLSEKVDDKDPETIALQGKYSDDMEELISKDPQAYKDLALRYKSIIDSKTTRPELAAFMWNRGHNTDLSKIDESSLENDDYVGRFKQASADYASLPRAYYYRNLGEIRRFPASTASAAAEAPSVIKTNAPEKPKDDLSNLIDSIYGPSLGMGALRDAQASRDKINLLAGMTSAGDRLAAALSRGAYRPSDAAAEAIRKTADSGIQDIQQGRALIDQNMGAKLRLSDLKDKEAMRDPNSPLSAAYRSMALQLRPELAKDPNFPQMSAEAVKNLHNMVETMVRLQGIREAKLQAQKEEKDKEVNKRFEKLAERISGERAGSRTGMGKLSQVMRSAEQIEKVVEGRDYNNLDSREIAELARQLDAILSGGSPTISGMKKLIPDAMSGDAAKIQEYLFSVRKSAGMGTFVKQMLDTVARERELAKNKLAEAQLKLAAGSLDLARDYPERWNTIMVKHDLPTAEEFLGSVMPKKQVNVTDEEAKKYYEMYKGTHPNLTLEGAKAILEKRKAEQGK